MIVVLQILFVLVSLLLILMVVITPSQSEGLAGAFGGMGSDTFFGTKAGQHVNRFTIVLALVFVLLAVGINSCASAPDRGLDLKESPAPSPDLPSSGPP